MVFKGKEAIMKVLGRASTQMREDQREVVYPTPKCAVFTGKGLCKHKAEWSISGGDGAV